MNIDLLEKKDFFIKYQKIQDIKIILKTEFIGLDAIIDDICDLIEPWYLFPNAQIRPTVINLWGLTSVGKTSLVLRIFQLLDMKNVFKFDVGEYNNNSSEYELKNKITHQMQSNQKNDNIPIFIFDEFQLGRTLADSGDELDIPALRVIWDLLDIGKISAVETDWESEQIYKTYMKLNYVLSNGVKVKNGSVVGNKTEYDRMFNNSDKAVPEGTSAYDFSDSDIIPDEIFNITDPFFPILQYSNIRYLDNRFLSDYQVMEYLKKLDGKQTLEFVKGVLDRSMEPKIYDFSNSIVFIIGNLDKAYQMSDIINPDEDADEHYEYTKKITLVDIKQCLTLLYRPEQISRLGNNHIIYRSFTSQNYVDIIKLELKKYTNKIKEKFNIDIKFTDNVESIIYKEGVFPTQGVRPIFSTIVSMIESYTGKIMIDILKKDLNPNEIVWDYNNYQNIISFDDNEFKYPVKLKIDNLRESKNDDRQALVGIHEAGHVLASIYALNICPKLVVSKTANNSGGFTHIEGPEWQSKEYLMNRIITSISGYMAEKLVFGEENLTTGSYSDLKYTTETALKIIKEYGMNGTPLQYTSPDFRISSSQIALNTDEMDRQSINLVKECMIISENILTENMTLLLKIGEFLLHNSKMTSDQIKNMMSEYSPNKVVFKDKDNYNNFKSILNDKVKNIQ